MLPGPRPRARAAPPRYTPLENADPQLHRAIWNTYRHAMQYGHTQRDAFGAALDVLVADAGWLPDHEARRLVARMLTQEPPREAGAS
jgi:hypothetical protein